MNNLELIKITGNYKHVGKYYWCMDSELAYLESCVFETEKEAVLALVNNDIDWRQAEV